MQVSSSAAAQIAAARQAPARDAKPAQPGIVLERAKDGSVKVPELGFKSEPRAAERFSFELSFADRPRVAAVKAAIDGIGQLTGTNVSTQVRDFGFHAGEIPISGVVRGARSDVQAAINAINEVARQATAVE